MSHHELKEVIIMSSVLIWGWYPTDKIWVPIQVDANGKLVVTAG
ncbi:unnamed protein product [marine sediment metagenome]|uniref:Uncharacterized protein n=1 Tax=marine sediment metagenome TaxID=412755 RepID=X1KR07_9ZZZZ